MVMKGFGVFVSGLVLIAALQTRAQYDYSAPAPPPAPLAQILSGTQLDQLLGAIALYPDPLIAQIFPAATQPQQIAVAANYLSSGGDPNLVDQQPWDSSVQAVAHFPDVIQMMNGNMQWTTELGQAYLNQPTDVMNSIQRLRAQAQAMGNLQTGAQQTVVNNSGEIEILPTDPNVIYVPQYDPGVIYYQRPYYGLVSFGLGFHIGPWFDFDFDWGDHRIIHWDRDHPRPNGWWRERPEARREVFARAPVWHPAARRVESRPGFVVSRGDRGYAPRPAPHVEPPREVRPAPPREVRPALPVPSLPHPPGLPGLPSPGKLLNPFSGGSAHEARAASVRGAESRGGGGDRDHHR